jgi:hypothetical protein
LSPEVAVGRVTAPVGQAELPAAETAKLLLEPEGEPAVTAAAAALAAGVAAE